MERGKDLIRKPLKIAAIAGIIFVIVVLTGSFLSNIIQLSDSFAIRYVYSVVYSLIAGILAILFRYGFYVLGKRYKNKNLRTATLTLIVVIILGILLTLISFPFYDEFTASMETFNETINENMSGDQIFSAIQGEFVPVMPFMITSGILSLISVIAYLFVGTSLIKLKDKIKYAKLTGRLLIIGVLLIFIPLLAILLSVFLFLSQTALGLGLFLILVGGLLMIGGGIVIIVTYVFSLLILFNESKKFKE